MKKSFLKAALIFSVFISCRNTDKPTPETWQMHIVHNGFIIANSLSPGDVNQDGFTDYAVIDESLGLYTVVFNPGKTGDVHKEWERTIVSASGK